MDTDTIGVWIPASAGDATRFGRILGHDGRGWTLAVVTSDQVEVVERIGGFVASDDAERYLVG